MTLQTHSNAEIASILRYLDAEGRPSERAIASILRTSLNRWGLSPKQAVLKYTRDELETVGVEDISCVPRVLQRLIDLGECDELYVGADLYLAPTAPRWVSVGDGIASYLGVADPPSSLSLADSDHHDIVRRLIIKNEDDITTLEISGIQEISLSEWLVPPGYLHHASRRMSQPARSDAVSLGGFWELLEKAHTDEAMALGADAEVRVLEGRPGDFFGRHDSQQPEGRWTIDALEGLWCAYRRGYGDRHWHPCIVAVADGVRRALDLYDADEWQWAVIARGRRVGSDEIPCKKSGRVQLTFQAPSQVRAGMDILGHQSGAWAWNVSPDGPDLWQLLT